MITWTYNDGGRAAAGYTVTAAVGDCVTRSIAIATGLPYAQVYAALNRQAERERPRKGNTRSQARNGVARPTYEKYLTALGWTWIPTMQIGSGCKVHLRADELPTDRPLIIRVSRHVTAMMYGVIHDRYDPSRNGTRCVYGYYQPGPNCTTRNER